MLDRPTVDALDRTDYRLSGGSTKYNDRWWTLGLAVLGSALLFPLFELPYVTFPLAFAGFTMIPFIIAAYIWYVEVLGGGDRRIMVSEITAPVLLPPLPPK